MKAFDVVKAKLENFPDFRERKFRAKYLAILALRELELEDKYNIEIPLKIEELVEFAIKFDTYRHAWTDVTKECEELRGSDWSDKEVLEQEKQLELGYSPNHRQQVRELGIL